MKKTLIALAALAATAGVAHAQSSVTLYGIADAFVGVNQTQVTGATAATTTPKLRQGVVNGSGLSSSRWGLRGTEDLGGGLAAVFTLESGFDISTGSLANNGGSNSSTASVLFGRQAWVGLKGTFGETRLGRQYTAYDSLRGVTNNTYDSNTFATTGAVWGTGVQDYSNRINNAISYATPVFGGFSGSVVYGFGEDKTATTTTAGVTTPGHSASNSVSAQVRYANGPLLAGYAFQRERSAVGSTIFSGANTGVLSTVAVGSAAAADTRKYHLFAASYDLGVAKLVGSYNQAKSNTFKDKEYQVGVSVPFGAASVAAGFTKSKSDSRTAAVNSNDGTGYSLLGTYDLSKRTTFYAGYINLKSESANGATEAKRSLFGTGVRHTF
jgi:predicted porin